MWKRVVIATIIGGTAVFIWCMAAWMFLPWYKISFSKFENESIVARSLSENAPQSGLYLIPNISDFSGNAKAELEKKYLEEPLAFVVFSKEGGNDLQMKKQIIIELLVDLIGALIIATLLSTASGLSYINRVLFVVGAGLAASILGNVPNYNWWHFPLNFTAIAIADALVAWLIAGLLMAAIVRRK